MTYMSFGELLIAYPNGGHWAPFSYDCPLAQTSSDATGLAVLLTVYKFVTQALSFRLI